MAKDYLAAPCAQVRRKDRAVDDDAWIVEFLRRAPMAQLATIHDGQPFINSNLFAYDADEHAVYMHTAPVGRTRSNVDADERACVSVSEMGRLLPSHEALTMSVEYDGVAIFGRARVLSDDAERERGLRLILDKYFPHLAYGDDYRAITPDELARTSVYRIDIDAWSGKRKRVDDDFAGAFRYGAHPSQRGGSSMTDGAHTSPDQRVVELGIELPRRTEAPAASAAVTLRRAGGRCATRTWRWRVDAGALDVRDREGVRRRQRYTRVLAAHAGDQRRFGFARRGLRRGWEARATGGRRVVSAV